MKALIQFRKDIDGFRERLWIIELMTLEAMVKKKNHYEEIF